MTNKQAAKVIAHLVNYCTMESSDCNENMVIRMSMDWSRSQIKIMTGLTPHEIPSDILEAVKFLQKLR